MIKKILKNVKFVKINTRIFLQNMVFVKISTSKMRPKYHLQKQVPTKIYNNKYPKYNL